MTKLIESAMMAYTEVGVSVIPVNHRSKQPAWWLLPQAANADGQPLFTKQVIRDDGSTFTIATTEDTGKPKRTWKPYQSRIATADEVRAWCNVGIKALAVVGGAVSSGLEILDFDNRLGETWYKQWADLAGDPVATFNLPLQKTGGNGYQVAWRSSAIGGNQKLAWIPAPEEDCGRKAMIETRHDGGYALWAPSLHPSGRHYEILNSTLSKVPTIDIDLRNHLIDCARRLCQSPDEPAQKKPATAVNYVSNGQHVVRDAFNRANSVTAMLQRYSFTHVGGNRWSRPGKEDSAGVHVFDNGKAYEYSSNGKMRGDRVAAGKNQPFDAFDLYAEYDHNGDYKAATIEAAKLLGLWIELHTLLFVEGRDNAAAIREPLFKQGWVTRGFDNNSVNAAGIAEKGYKNVLVWTYDAALGKAIARMIPGAYAFTYPDGQDAKTMAADGILDTYLSAVLADAQGDYTGEVTTWTL